MSQLLFCLIYFTISKQRYKEGTDFSQFINIFFNPREIVEVNITKQYGAFFGGWSKNKNIFLSIYSYTKNNEIETYGDFESKNDLAGVIIREKDYILKFTNRSPHNAQIGIIVSQRSFKNMEYQTHLDFPVLKYDSIDDFDGPFIYAKDDGGLDLFIYIPVFLMFTVIFISYFAKSISSCFQVHDW